MIAAAIRTRRGRKRGQQIRIGPGRVTIVALRQAWQQLAERTVAGLSSTSADSLTEVLTDLARNLNSDDEGHP